MIKKRCFHCMKEYDEVYEVCPFCGYIEGTPPEEAYFLHPGEILNRRYIVGTAIEQGGFGIVYRAYDAQMDQKIAIKEFFPAGIVNRAPGEREVQAYGDKNNEIFRKGVQRFLTEAINLADFSHPNIATMYEYFEENNTAYIAMEYLDGISLKDYLEEKDGGLPEEEAVDITLQVLEGLKEIHSHQIIHRDISPDNIFLCEGGRIKIIDFGAARFSSGEKEETYSKVVKPGYAPSEQYRDRSRQGSYTDIYAVGACLYHMLTGQQPADSMSRLMKEQNILIDPQALNPSIPDYLNAIILKAMEMDPEDRFADSADFSKALKNKELVQADRQDAAKKKKKKKRKKQYRRSSSGPLKKILKIAAVLAAMLALSFATLWVIINKTEWIDTDYKGPIQFLVPESREAYYDKVINDYGVETGKTITLETLPDQDYESKIREILKSQAGKKEGPVLFLTQSFSKEDEEKTRDLEKVCKRLEEIEFYYLDEYKKKEKDLHSLPAFFRIPMLIGNPDLGRTPAGPVKNVSELKARKGAKPKILYEVKEDVSDQVSALGIDEKNTVKGGKDSAFQKQNAAFYFTDWGDFLAMVNQKPSILYPSEETPFTAELSDYVCISSKAPIQAQMDADGFLAFLLARQAKTEWQDLNPAGLLPVNKKATDDFANIYTMKLAAGWDTNTSGSEQFKHYLESCKVQ